jgi:hypothetical protein
MIAPRYDAALKAQIAAREAERKKEEDAKLAKYAEETDKYIASVDDKLKPVVTALSTGAEWYGLVTSGERKTPAEKPKDAKEAAAQAAADTYREGIYRLAVSYRIGAVAHATHVSVRPAAEKGSAPIRGHLLGFNQAVVVQTTRHDIEVQASAAQDALAKGWGYHLPGTTGAAAQKVYRAEIRVSYQDKDNAFKGIFDPATGQIAGHVYAHNGMSTPRTRPCASVCASHVYL